MRHPFAADTPGVPRSLLAVALLCAVWAAVLLALFAAKQAPLGAVSGRVLAEDTGQPLSRVELLLAPADPSMPGRSRRLLVDQAGRFHLRRLHAGEYLISASTRAHSLAPTRVVITEGRTTDMVLELTPNSPFLSVYVPQHVFVPGEPVQVTAHGFTRDETLSVEAYEVDALRVMRDAGGSLWRVLSQGGALHAEDPEKPIALRDIPGLVPAARLSVPLPRDAEGVFTRRVTLPLSRPGLYAVACRADGMERLDWVMVTDLGLVTKHAGNRCLAYAADLTTGAPVPGAEVNLIRGGQERFRGRCDSEGLLDVPLGSGTDTILLLARRGESLAFVQLWSGEEETGPQARVFLFSDRPVYRPGQRVHLKGIARELAGTDLRVPADLPVSLEVLDPRGTLVHASDPARGQAGALHVRRDYGSFDDRFDLSPEAATGTYTVRARVGEQVHEDSFSVAAYRKPEYQVEVRPEKESLTRGEPGWVTAEARYFFGAPVAGARVEYVVMRAPLWHWQEEESFLPYGDEAGEGEVVAMGEARTDARGRCRFRFETAPARQDDAGRSPEIDPAEHDYRYSIEATVLDQGSFAATGSTQVKVYRGEVALDVEPGRFVAAVGQSVPVTATVRNHQGQAEQGVPVEITLVRRHWDKEGFTEVEAGTARAESDASGKVTATFEAPRAGDYLVRALARDRRGNRVPASAYLWVTGRDAGAEAVAVGPDLQVVADRKEYRPGDVATFLINTGRAGSTLLVTAEADGVLQRQVLRLTGASTSFRLPITNAHLPDFSLNVCLVRNKEFSQREVRVNVSPRPRALRVEVSADRAVYSPGEIATYRVRTLDADGRPVPAEVCLGVVDESIYRIQEDRADILAAFYPRRYNRVMTGFSFPQIYLSGPDKSGVADSVRKQFPDTALWEPSLRTNARGEAMITLRVPDTLTAWRATARAHTLGTLVGQATSQVVCRKELMVRLQGPRFFTAGDSGVVSALVHNESGAPQQAIVSLKAEGLRLEGKPESRVRLRPGQVARLDWKVLAEQPGACRLEAAARAESGLRDAVELRLPVRPHGRAHLDARSGTLAGDGEARERLSLRSDGNGPAVVTLQMAPSLAAGMLSALDFLAHYPYGCTEQTMSAFLPDLVVHQALSRLGVHSPRLRKQIPDMVNTGLHRLYRFQHDDGGWGWWEHDDSDAGMTAYVVGGLLDARDAGYAVNPEVLQRGVDWLENQERQWLAKALGASPDQAQALRRNAESGRLAEAAASGRLGSRGRAPQAFPLVRARVLLALARAGRGEALLLALGARPGDVQATLGAEALAVLSLGAARAGDLSTAAALRRRLETLASDGPVLSHWESDPEATAAAIQALLAGAEQGQAPPPIVLRAARWLLTERQGDHWVSTQATARVLFALVDVLAASGETRPDFQVVPIVNGKALQAVRFAPVSVFAPEVRVQVPAGVLRPGENELRLRKRGPGNLYYTVRARQFIGGENVPALVGGAGIAVERSFHRLRPARDPETGETRLMPAPRAETRLVAGESYLGRITVRSSAEFEHIVIEEPLPAGCEPLDRGRVDRGDWNHWWTDVDVRDEQIAFFARRLKKGTHTVEYYVRAAVPGRYHVMPTQLSGMYDPALRAGGAETRVEVK